MFLLKRLSILIISEYILLKLSNEFSEVNIYFPKDNIQEFKDFAVKGNAVDMAVGVIIGGAFGKILLQKKHNT